MKDLIVYTAITRNYDILKPPPTQWLAEADFIAFLDEPMQAAMGWQYAPLHREFKDPCRNAKIHKILSHYYFPQAKYTLWVDGSFLIKSLLSLPALISEYLACHDLAVFKHRSRKCIYEEARRCRDLLLDRPEVIDRQILKYQHNAYPPGNGLAECGVLLRRHTQNIKLFNELWHQEILHNSRRDQLSFNYVSHQHKLGYAYFPGDVSNNPHFLCSSHATPRQIDKSLAFVE